MDLLRNGVSRLFLMRLAPLVQKAGAHAQRGSPFAMSSLKSNLLVVVSAGGQTQNGRFRWLQECERQVKHRLQNYVLLTQTVSPESPTGRDSSATSCYCQEGLSQQGMP
jgi:hypothetical protein